MNAIVIQLQRDALDQQVAVSGLLRKALVVARKLKILEFREWATNELEGYSSDTLLPKYRILRGQVRAQNPYHGWIPVMIPDPERSEELSKRKCYQSIPELESLIDIDDNGFLAIPFPDHMSMELCRGNLVTYPIALHIQRSSIIGILNRVRDTILNWALQLEEDGILGSNLTFSSQEQSSAASHTYNITNFYGDAHNSQVSQGSERNMQSFSISGPRLDELIDFINRLRNEMNTMDVSDDCKQTLNADLATIETQRNSPKPDNTIIRETLLSIRRILESAAGSNAAVLLAELSSFLS